MGVIATFVAPGLLWLGEYLGVAGAKPIAELLLALVLIYRYPEHGTRRWSLNLVAMLVAVAMSLALVWIVAFAWGRTRFIDVSLLEPATIALTVLSAVITAPLFEEKVVRGLLVHGLAQFTRPLISAVLVSVAFALAHDGAMLWSFMVSMLLCALALKWRVSSLQRALVHGLLNLLILLWYATCGYGIFSECWLIQAAVISFPQR